MDTNLKQGVTKTERGTTQIRIFSSWWINERPSDISRFNSAVGMNEEGDRNDKKHRAYQDESIESYYFVRRPGVGEIINTKYEV